jgi:dTDP-4-amino-4,6-dideoxygalactose transaminase
MKNKIKLFDPKIDSHEEQAIANTLKSHFWASGEGTGEVKKFENKFKNYINCKSCVAVNSGTAALHLAFSLIDIRRKEVLLPSLSFVSTAHAVMYNGGIPKFVDIEEESLCINPELVADQISKKTCAILPVHFGGMPANMDAISKISKKNNCYIIEDAAHAVGSTYKNNRIGSQSFAVCFSFHPVKNLAMPTGGLIALNGSDYRNNEKLLKTRRWCGISDRKEFSYNVTELGWNMYMNEFSASIGQVQLSKLDIHNKKRKKIAKTFSQEINLANKMPFDKNCSYHLYWIRVRHRKQFMKQMKQFGIETGIHYKPIHEMTYYQSKKNKNLKITEKISKEIVSIPIHPNLKENEIDFIINCINKIS